MQLFILDDHQLFCEGLVRLLAINFPAAEIRFFNEYQSAKEYFETVRFADDSEKVLFLDIQLNKVTSGIDVCKELMALYPRLKIIALSMHTDSYFITEMLNAGAVGYLSKEANLDELKEAIHSALKGEVYLGKKVEEVTTEKKICNTVIANLNSKEKKVFDFVLDGKTNKEIANVMELNIKTIEYYRSTLFLKFDVKNIIELINKVKQWERHTYNIK